MLLTLLAVVLLLAINGFFVAAEFALVKASGVRMQQLAAGNSGPAQLAVRIQGNLESYLAACQLGITMASLGLGWVGEPAVAALLEPLFAMMGLPDALLHTVAFLTGFLLFSSLHIVVGEQVPKTLAIRRAEPVSLWVAYPLHVSYLLVWPLNWLLNASSRSILAWLNIAETTHADVFNEAELKSLVSSSQEQGAIEDNKADMLHKILEFDQHPVARVMIPRAAVEMLDLAREPAANERIIAATGHSRFPLFDSRREDPLLGIVLAKKLYLAVLEGDADVWSHLEDFCVAPLVVPENQLVGALFEQMRGDRVHMAVVVDEYGEFAGIATLEDLLEEIVGEIEDEQDDTRNDVGPADIRRLGDGLWQIDGMTSLLDLNRELPFPLPTREDVNTLGGLLSAGLQRLPSAGDTLHVDPYQLTVKDMAGRRVGRVEVRQLSPADPADKAPVAHSVVGA
ncbi:MAG: hemolysin family protein [Halioglobus sp.]|nr:hemolysin family protein [Halioglobus sp.]